MPAVPRRVYSKYELPTAWGGRVAKWNVFSYYFDKLTQTKNHWLIGLIKLANSFCLWELMFCVHWSSQRLILCTSKYIRLASCAHNSTHCILLSTHKYIMHSIMYTGVQMHSGVVSSDLFCVHNKNKTNHLILNLTPENITQHSGIEWQLHTKEAQHPLKWAK